MSATRTSPGRRGASGVRCRCRSVALYDCHAQAVPYEAAWAWQRRRAEAVAARGPHAPPQALLLLQHPPTLTLGTGSSLEHLRFRPEAPPFPLFRTERGGEVTYHGPGQLVLYPILDLREHGQDLHTYMRDLEEVVLRALLAVSGIEAFRVPGKTGALRVSACAALSCPAAADGVS